MAICLGCAQSKGKVIVTTGKMDPVPQVDGQSPVQPVPAKPSPGIVSLRGETDGKTVVSVSIDLEGDAVNAWQTSVVGSDEASLDAGREGGYANIVLMDTLTPAQAAIYWSALIDAGRCQVKISPVGGSGELDDTNDVVVGFAECPDYVDVSVFSRGTGPAWSGWCLHSLATFLDRDVSRAKGFVSMILGGVEYSK